MEANLRKIAVFTSGGDSPGMNACIRAVVRAGINYGIEVMGIMRGYAGMIDGELVPLDSYAVSNIIQRGGTILKSARSKEFMTAEGRKKAYENLVKYGIEGVVAIGGDGTFKGATEFSRDYDIPFVGVPGTIDNDLYGTDNAIGYDTAVNTAVEAIDKIKDTAHSHNRLFFVEVMGRDAGFIALRSGIAGGAESVLIPETRTTVDQLIATLNRAREHKKTSMIVVVAEGDEEGGAIEIAKKVKEKFDFDTRVTILGHIQRGGAPTCYDRVLSSRLGVAAVEALRDGKRNIMVGVWHRKIEHVPFEKAIKHHKDLDSELLKLCEMLAL